MTDAELQHIILFITKGTSWPGVFVLTQSCPFPPWLCSLFQQSTSDVCQQAERAPHDAFPFPRHKHTGNTHNTQKIGSVCTVKSQFVQKWVQVASHTFGRISNDLATHDDRWTSFRMWILKGKMSHSSLHVPTYKLVILVGINCTLWTILYIFFSSWQNRKILSTDARQIRANNAC